MKKTYFFYSFLSLAAFVLSLFLLIFFKNTFLLVLTTVLLILVLVQHFYLLQKLFRASVYEKVYRIITQLSHITDLHSLLDFMIHSISDLLNAERSTVFLLNKETKMLWTLVAEELEIKEIVLPVGQGIAGYVAKTGEVVRINTDVYKDDRFSPLVDQKTGFRTKTVLCAPIYNKKNEIIGVLEVLNKKSKQGFTKKDEELLELFCSEIASIIETTQLYGQIQTLLESLIRSFATAVDARDPATKGHSLRVMKYAVNIAKELKLSPAEVKILEYAAILHDVGKIGVPDSILLKPEKFTTEEYEIMKKHVEITKEILSKIYFPDDYKNIPLIASMHHEFLDGSGYPQGLKKEQIPLLAQILCVVDIYDALVSYDRPYKPPYPQQEAIRILYEMAQQGKLNKNIVDVFISKKLYQIEQRKFVRVNKEVSIAWRKLSSEDIKSLLPILSKTVNISAGGLQFISNEPLATGSYLEVEIYLPNFTLDTVAKVIHCTETAEDKNQYRVGIAFLNLSKETQQKLDRYLQQTS